MPEPLLRPCIVAPRPFRSGSLCAAAFAAAITASPAGADPPPGLFEATETALASCKQSGGPGQILDGYETNADLNGDGLTDYITDQGHIACGRNESALCDAEGCNIAVWLSAPDGQYRMIDLTKAVRHEMIAAPASGKLSRLRTIHAGAACSAAGLDTAVCSRIWTFAGATPAPSAYLPPPPLRPEPRPPIETLPRFVADSGWSLRKAADESPVALGIGPGNLLSLGAFCLQRMPFLVLRFRTPPQAKAITLTFGFSDGPLDVKALFEPTAGGAFVIDLTSSRLAARLAGADSAVGLEIDGKAAGDLSLRGSTASLRTALSACYEF
jgi:hypothetical protein